MNGSLLVIHASPRKAGNSSFLAEVAVRAAREANPRLRVEDVHLHGMSITPCSACDACREETPGRCIRNDDMQPLYEKLKAADAVLFAAPVYWASVCAQLKLFIDRLYSLYNDPAVPLSGKAAGAVLVYGDTDYAASGAANAVGTMTCTFGFAGFVSKGILCGSTPEYGDAESSKELKDQAEDLGRRLAG